MRITIRFINASGLKLCKRRLKASPKEGTSVTIEMSLGKIVGVLVICLVTTASAYPVRRWTYAEEEGDTNYDFGLAFGKEFEREIKVRLSSDISLKKLVEEFGTENNHVYAQFMASHKNAFPEYMDELQGVADSSGVPFTELFIDQQGGIHVLQSKPDGHPRRIETSAPLFGCGAVSIERKYLYGA